MDRWGLKGPHHPHLAASLRACTQPGVARNMVVAVSLAVALAAAEATHGTVTHTLRTIRRCAATAVPPGEEEKTGGIQCMALPQEMLWLHTVPGWGADKLAAVLGRSASLPWLSCSHLRGLC